MQIFPQIEAVLRACFLFSLSSNYEWLVQMCVNPDLHDRDKRVDLACVCVVLQRLHFITDLFCNAQ